MASSEDHYDSVAVDQEIQRRVGECFAYDWAATPLDAVQNSSYETDQNPFAWLLARVADGVGNTTDAISRVVMHGSTGAGILDRVSARAVSYAAAKHLAPHQKVLVTSCVTSNLIEYASSVAAKLSPEKAVELGVGICTEYAVISERLLRDQGLHATATGNMRELHAFVVVWIPGPGGDTVYDVDPGVDPRVQKKGFFMNPRHP